MAGSHRKLWVEEPALRQTAFSIEQMAPGGIEREDPGALGREDLDRAFRRIDELLGRPTSRDRARRAALLDMRDRTERLDELYRVGASGRLIYVGPEVHDLEPRLRSAALEIDFAFGDRNGHVSEADVRKARFHYGQVRGPVGWNRLLLTDEVERRLFPERTLRSTNGLKLRPIDWIAGPPNPLARLEKAARYLDDAALARTYADIAARLACSAPSSDEARLYEQALLLLGTEIRDRGSVRPTLTDIARIGCEDPTVKATLSTPIEMSRKLSPAALLDRFLS